MTETAITSTAPTPQIPIRLDFEKFAPNFMRAMTHLDNAATKELDAVEFDPRLRELVRLRASQLNGCAYCIDQHSRDARAVGESEQRLYAVSAWAETPLFTERERAALAFTESVTLLAHDHVPQAAFDAVAAQFSPAEIGALLSLITAINAWNVLAVSSRAWPVTPAAG